MCSEDGPAADIAGEALEFREHRAVQQNRVAAEPSVHWNRDLRSVFAILLDKMVDRGRPHERLIGQHYQRCLGLGIDSRNTHSQ